jgi:hypothetical protein
VDVPGEVACEIAWGENAIVRTSEANAICIAWLLLDWMALLSMELDMSNASALRDSYPIYFFAGFD